MVTISKQWTGEVEKRDIARLQETGVQSLHLARQQIREFIQSGVVEKVQLLTANDSGVCKVCQEYSGKSFQLDSEKERVFVMNNAKIKGCENPHCRCTWISHTS
ncbi:MAG: hypothetical protein AAB445_03590 [Patescibacteria group bacterium]